MSGKSKTDKSKDASKEEKPAVKVTADAIRKLLGAERFAQLKERTAVFETCLKRAIARGEITHQDNEKAAVSLAAIRLCQFSGVKPGDDLVEAYQKII
jgi:pheromone shutdown protein TraB